MVLNGKEKLCDLLKHNGDRIMMTGCVMYIVLPIIIYFFGWLRFPVAIVCSAGVAYFVYRVVLGFREDEDVSITRNMKFWLVALSLIALWVMLSGIGGFSFQTSDFKGRNAMFRDLFTHSWPVIYDLSLEPSHIKETFFYGVDNAMFVYYFALWLPAAFIGRVCFHFGMSQPTVEIIANCSLYVWVVLGLFLTFYCLVRYLKKYSYWILGALVFFGGLDAVIYFIENFSFPNADHVEWWAGGIGVYFQYSANTTQLFWVFNQSVPVWLIMAVLLLLRDNRGKCAWGSLAFAYSPFATLGVIPFVLAGLWYSDEKDLKKKILSAISPENIMVPLVMLVIFLPFYSLVMQNAARESGFIFSLRPEQRTLTLYVLFILFEVGIYFFAMGSKAMKYHYYWITLLELLLIPMIRYGELNDFCMRVSIPALFVLMTLCLQRLGESEAEGDTLGFRVLLFCMALGALTSVFEIQRNFKYTLEKSQGEYIDEAIYSFGYIKSENDHVVGIHIDQYMSKDFAYKNSVYYKYLMKH